MRSPKQKEKKRPRGRPKSSSPKDVVSVRLDAGLRDAVGVYGERYSLSGPSVAIRHMVERVLADEKIPVAALKK